MEIPHVDLVLEEEGKRFLLDALALAETGLAELEDSYRRALGILENSRGSDHHEVSTLRRHLADVGDARRRVLGPGHPDVATTLHNLALLHEAEGRATESAALWAEARAVLESAPLVPGSP